MADYALGNFNILIYKIINDFLQIFEKNTSIAYWKDFQNFNFHLKLQKTSLKICKQVLLNSCVQVLPWTGLIAIERASPIDQFRLGLPWTGLIVIARASTNEQFRSGLAWTGLIAFEVQVLMSSSV